MRSFLRVTFDFNLLPQSVTVNHRPQLFGLQIFRLQLFRLQLFGSLSEGGTSYKYITLLCYWRVIWV